MTAARGTGAPGSTRGWPLMEKPRKTTPADWSLWSHIPTLQLWQAVALSFGYEPGDDYPHGMPAESHFSHFPEDFGRRLKIAVAQAGSLLPIVRASDRRSMYAEVRLDDFGKWAKDLAWPIPVELPSGGPTAIASGFDPSDLPMELDCANQAFRAVSNGYGDSGDTFKNRLTAWLTKHCPNLGDSARERIATVANPDKEPGRKKRTSN